MFTCNAHLYKILYNDMPIIIIKNMSPRSMILVGREIFKRPRITIIIIGKIIVCGFCPFALLPSCPQALALAPAMALSFI